MGRVFLDDEWPKDVKEACGTKPKTLTVSAEPVRDTYLAYGGGFSASGSYGQASGTISDRRYPIPTPTPPPTDLEAFKAMLDRLEVAYTEETGGVYRVLTRVPGVSRSEWPTRKLGPIPTTLSIDDRGPFYYGMSAYFDEKGAVLAMDGQPGTDSYLPPRLEEWWKENQ
jgi:hypothetical protein